MISDKHPYSRESKSHGRRSSILKRQDSCFTSEGADGNTECPRTPRRVSFASTATVRYLHISSGDESCISSNNGSDTSSTSSGSSQSTDHDSVFAEPIPQLQDSCNGPVDHPSVFEEDVCNSVKDTEMDPSAAAPLMSDEDKTIVFTSMNMSLSNPEPSLWLGDNDEPNCISMRQQEQQNHTILYTETDQDGCCMELTSNLSQLSESLLQESNAHVFNNALFSSEPHNEPGLKRRPSFADGGKSESGDDQTFVRMCNNSEKENVPDCTIIFGNKGGEEMEFTQHEIIPVTCFNSEPHNKPGLKRRPSFADGGKSESGDDQTFVRMCNNSEKENVPDCTIIFSNKGGEEMEFTQHEIIPVTRFSSEPHNKPGLKRRPSFADGRKSESGDDQNFVRMCTNSVMKNVPDCTIIFANKGGEEMEFTQHEIIPVTGRPYLDDKLSSSITLKSKPKHLDDLFQLVKKKEPHCVMPCSRDENLSQGVEDMEFTGDISQVVPRTALSDITELKVLPSVNQSVPPALMNPALPQILFSRAPPPVLVNQVVESVVTRRVPAVVHHALPNIVSQAVPPTLGQAVPPTLSQAVPPTLSQAVPPTFSQAQAPVLVSRTVASFVTQTRPPIIDQELPKIVSQTQTPFVNQAPPDFVTQTLLAVVDQAMPQTASETMSPVSNQALSSFVSRALPPVIDQAVPRFASESVSPFSDQMVSPVVSQELSPIVDQAVSPIVNQSILPILVSHAVILEEGSFLSDLESVCKTEQMLSESVNLQDLYEILGISRLERAHVKSVPVQKLPAATGGEKLVAKTISMSRLCCLKQHLNEIEAAINRSEQECTEKLIQFSDKPPEILAAFQAKGNNVSDLRSKAQAVVNSCRVLAQAVWKRYKVDYHMKYSEAIERECQALDVHISEVVSSTEKVLDLTAVVDQCLQKVDLILGQKKGLTKQQEQLDETERELQKLRLQCKQMDDRVNACTQEHKEGAVSLTSIDVSQEGIEERLSWMNSFTEWTILKKSKGKIHFGFLFNTLILEVVLTDNSNSCQQMSRVNVHSRLASGSKPWAKLAHNLAVLNVSRRRLQDSYTDYNQMQQLLADVSAIVCDFRQFNMELKLAHLKHCLTIDDNRLKVTISNRKTRQKIALSTAVEPNYHPHDPLVWTATTLIGSVSPQDVKSAVDQIVHGPNYMTRVLSQTEKLLATMKR